jgi:hypothetical protein
MPEPLLRESVLPLQRETPLPGRRRVLRCDLWIFLFCFSARVKGITQRRRRSKAIHPPPEWV